MDEVEYLGYILMQNGIEPMPENISAILAIEAPRNVKELRRFLGMVQYYCDLWERRSKYLAPLTDLVGECGHTKETRHCKTKKKPWHWNNTHQKAFEDIKRTMARDVSLAYPNYSIPFEVYTDASSRQLGAVIVQNNRPLAYFSRKLSETQRKYSVTELELLSIVETLKEFKGILWGQRIKVYTDHKNLMQEALGLTSDRVYRWRLLLEEYGPEITYIKGIDNTVADALSRLEYDPNKNLKRLDHHTRFCHMVTLLNHRKSKHGGVKRSFATMHNPKSSSDDPNTIREATLDIFANVEGSKQEIYPVTVEEIAQEQRKDRELKAYFKKKFPKGKKANTKFSVKVIDKVEILVYENT